MWKQYLQPDDADKKKELPPNQQEAKTEQPKLQKTASSMQDLMFPELGDNNRNQAIKRIAAELTAPETIQQLKQYDETNQYLDPDRMREFIIDIEKQMYNKSKDEYVKFARERCLILKNKNNKQLKFALLQGQLSVEDFVNKDGRELESEENKKKLEEASKWNMAA